MPFVDTEMEYLGFVSTSSGIVLSPKRTKAVMDVPIPSDTDTHH